MNQPQRLGRALIAVAVAGSLAACSGAAPAGPTSASTGTAPTSAPVTTGPTLAPATAAPTPAGVAFQTHFFSPSLDLAVPAFVKATPDEESAHFVTFFAADGARAIRIMSPVSVFPPGATKATALPVDYVAYFDGLAASGAQLTDRIETTVDGHAAVVETVSSPTSYDGSIGCQGVGLAAADCFGIGPDLILRIAIVKTDAGPLLMWLRVRAADQPDMQAEAATFAGFLSGVQFADRQPAPEPTPADARYDGTYTWTITLADAKAGGQEISASDVPTYPWKFTMKLDGGVVMVKVTFAAGDPESGTGTYDASDGKLTLHFGGVAQVYGVTRDAKGSLHLTVIDVKNPGDAWVNTVKTWTKVP